MTTAAAPRARLNLMFRAFSERTRLRILSLLQDGECCVGDLVRILDIEQPSASRHLAYLRRAGLVLARREGQWSYYSLAPAQAPFHRKLLECLVCCFYEVPQIERDRKKADRLRAAGGCCPAEETRKHARASVAPRAGRCCSS